MPTATKTKTADKLSFFEQTKLDIKGRIDEIKPLVDEHRLLSNAVEAIERKTTAPAPRRSRSRKKQDAAPKQEAQQTEPETTDETAKADDAPAAAKAA